MILDVWLGPVLFFTVGATYCTLARVLRWGGSVIDVLIGFAVVAGGLTAVNTLHSHVGDIIGAALAAIFILTLIVAALRDPSSKGSA